MPQINVGPQRNHHLARDRQAHPGIQILTHLVATVSVVIYVLW
jgi:hypothetical protein